MILMLIKRKKTMLLLREYSDETSGSCTSKNANASTTSEVMRIASPSRFRRLVSSNVGVSLICCWVLKVLLMAPAKRLKCEKNFIF